MELARKKIEESRLISAADGLPLARVSNHTGGPVTATDIDDERPVVPVVSMKRRPDAPPPRTFDRYENRAAQRRSKKATRSRDRRVRSAETLRDTVLAQIRVASGETGASPALVANARKALQPRLDALRAEMPGLSDEEAFEGLRAALSVLR